MLHLASALHIADSPYSPELLDGLACSWARSRLRLPTCQPILEHLASRTPSAPAVAADCSALAARLRRLFLPCPEHLPRSCSGLGPLSVALLAAHGSAARHDASPKRVVWGWELRHGLAENPEVAICHPEAVAALLLMGASMWRSCYIRRLRACDAMSLPDGNIAIRWAHRHKTNRAVGDSLPSTPKLGFISCPWVLAYVSRFVSNRPGDSSPLLRDRDGAPLSYVYLTRVLRMLLHGLPLAAEATLHGLRVGCDSELKALGVADVIRDMMGWWKLALRRMSTHYEATLLSDFYAASNLYGSEVHHSLAPGIMATVGTYGADRHVSFSEPVALFARPRPTSFVAPVRDTEVATLRHVMQTAAASASVTRSAGSPRSPPEPTSSSLAPAPSVEAGSSLRVTPRPPLPAAVPVGDLTPVRRAAVAEAAAVDRAVSYWQSTGGPAAAARVRACGLCRQPGHNRRGCPSAQATFAAVNVPGEDESESDADDPEEVVAAARLAALPPPRATSSLVGASLASLLMRRA